MTVTTNLADFGHREREEVITLLTAWNRAGLPDDFEADGVHPAFNTCSGKVFLTNADFQVCMIPSGSESLESWYTTPHEGREGFFSDLCEEYPDMHETDRAALRELAEILGRSSEIPDDEPGPDDGASPDEADD